MKSIICITFVLLVYALNICSGQVRDSVCIHNFTKDYWQSIRPIDTAGYSGYISNSEYFKKSFRNDSLYIRVMDNIFYLPKTIFIGEYTTHDSIHFIDFIQIIRPQLRVCFEGVCSKFISRNQLPQLRKMTLCTNLDSFKLFDYELYVQHDSGFSTFKVKGPELPAEVRNSIMRLKENQYIMVDNVRITGPDGRRTIEGQTFQVKN